jgi:hypothetical protein
VSREISAAGFFAPSSRTAFVFLIKFPDVFDDRALMREPLDKMSNQVIAERRRGKVTCQYFPPEMRGAGPNVGFGA